MKTMASTRIRQKRMTGMRVKRMRKIPIRMMSTGTRRIQIRTVMMPKIMMVTMLVISPPSPCRQICGARIC